jgi:hypothetical protein
MTGRTCRQSYNRWMNAAGIDSGFISDIQCDLHG